jgi:hypothetical protein
MEFCAVSCIGVLDRTRKQLTTGSWKVAIATVGETDLLAKVVNQDTGGVAVELEAVEIVAAVGAEPIEEVGPKGVVVEGLPVPDGQEIFKNFQQTASTRGATHTPRGGLYNPTAAESSRCRPMDVAETEAAGAALVEDFEVVEAAAGVVLQRDINHRKHLVNLLIMHQRSQRQNW